jgi:3-dehydroquinate dehydratase-2
MAAPVFILNGPNLNLLGVREPDLYGAISLDQIAGDCRSFGRELGLEIDFRQTNHEGELVDWIQEAGKAGAPVVLNPGAYGHTSVALHDAIRGAGVTTVEVHLTNIHAREPFRHHSYVSPVAAGVICGFGPQGYLLALQAIARLQTPQRRRAARKKA